MSVALVYFCYDPDGATVDREKAITTWILYLKTSDCRWAGAMRGAVSVALVYFYYDPDGATVDRERSTLISMTLTVVLFSTLVFGAATKPLLDLMLGPESARPSAVICSSVGPFLEHSVLSMQEITWPALEPFRFAHGASAGIVCFALVA